MTSKLDDLIENINGMKKYEHIAHEDSMRMARQFFEAVDEWKENPVDDILESDEWQKLKEVLEAGK